MGLPCLFTRCQACHNKCHEAPHRIKFPQYVDQCFLLKTNNIKPRITKKSNNTILFIILHTILCSVKTWTFSIGKDPGVDCSPFSQFGVSFMLHLALCKVYVRFLPSHRFHPSISGEAVKTSFASVSFDPHHSPAHISCHPPRQTV